MLNFSLWIILPNADHSFDISSGITGPISIRTFRICVWLFILWYLYLFLEYCYSYYVQYKWVYTRSLDIAIPEMFSGLIMSYYHNGHSGIREPRNLESAKHKRASETGLAYLSQASKPGHFLSEWRVALAFLFAWCYRFLRAQRIKIYWIRTLRYPDLVTLMSLASGKQVYSAWKLQKVNWAVTGYGLVYRMAFWFL